jgi:hypothetical protein
MTAGGIAGTPAPWNADRRVDDRTGTTPTAADNCARNTRRFIDILLKKSWIPDQIGIRVRDAGLAIANDRMMAGG